MTEITMKERANPTMKERCDSFPYPEWALRKLREMHDLPEDGSGDNELETLSPKEILNDLLENEGIIDYTDTVLEFVFFAYGVQLEEN